MSIDKLTKEISERYPQRTSSEVRAVATDLQYSGIEADSIIVDRLFKRMEERAFAKDRPAISEDSKTCPICKTPLQAVALYQDRPALFCQKHFVVFPSDKANKGIP